MALLSYPSITVALKNQEGICIKKDMTLPADSYVNRKEINYSVIGLCLLRRPNDKDMWDL